jgi:TetR/AcrR family transcriptional regulator of autoinduction and epiphytic fitness
MVTDPEAMGAMRLIVSEYLRDLETSRAFFTQLGSYDYPVVEMIREAMDAGALEKSDAQLATGQLLALVRNYYSWPVLLFGEPQAADNTLDECVSMFMARYGHKLSNAD